MRRPLTPGLSPVVEALRVEQGQLVTLAMIEEARMRAGVEAPAKVIAARLRARGWLLPTGPRGVYEYAGRPEPDAPASSVPDPLVSVRAILLRNPALKAALTFRSAACAHGLADHAPGRPELTAATPAQAVALSTVGRAFVFVPRLPTVTWREVAVLAPESLLVHLAAKPNDVRHWSTAMGWLPRLAGLAELDRLRTELDARSRAVQVRLGYLLSGVRPDLAAALHAVAGPRVPFGTKGRVRRVDPDWHVADCLLPVPPTLLEPVRG